MLSDLQTQDMVRHDDDILIYAGFNLVAA